MYYDRRKLVFSCLAAIVAGVGLHFLYDWLPNPITALFSPVRESIWEHNKLIFWPCLAAAGALSRGRPGGMRPWLLILPLLCGGMLALGYGYHVLLDGRELAVDLAIYGLAMVLAFLLPVRFSGPFTGRLWALAPVGSIALGTAIVLFTFCTPEGPLFADMSALRTWLWLPV